MPKHGPTSTRFCDEIHDSIESNKWENLKTAIEHKISISSWSLMENWTFFRAVNIAWFKLLSISSTKAKFVEWVKKNQFIWIHDDVFRQLQFKKRIINWRCLEDCLQSHFSSLLLRHLFILKHIENRFISILEIENWWRSRWAVNMLKPLHQFCPTLINLIAFSPIHILLCADENACSTYYGDIKIGGQIILFVRETSFKMGIQNSWEIKYLRCPRRAAFARSETGIGIFQRLSRAQKTLEKKSFQRDFLGFLPHSVRNWVRIYLLKHEIFSWNFFKFY